MALQVKRKEDKFQLYCTISDELLHEEEWITREEALQILVERAYRRFIEEVIEIDMDFPKGYGDDEGRYIDPGKREFPSWIYEMVSNKKYDEITQKWCELVFKYKLFNSS